MSERKGERRLIEHAANYQEERKREGERQRNVVFSSLIGFIQKAMEPDYEK